MLNNKYVYVCILNHLSTNLEYNKNVKMLKEVLPSNDKHG